MCLAPVIILKKNSNYMPWQQRSALPSHGRIAGRLLLADRARRNELDYSGNGFSFDYFHSQQNYKTLKLMVPCGKCSQCLSKRQSDLAARCAAEARKRGSMCFVTLTYSNEFLPIACLLQAVDIDTGEVRQDYSLHSMPRPKLSRSKADMAAYGPLKPIPEQAECLRGLGNLSSRKVNEYEKDFFLDESEGLLYRYHFTPSLCTRDVRLWIKRARMKYERDYCEKLPEFTYVLCGEYGSNTHRPHYHLGFFGLQKKHVDFLCSLWYFGFSYIQQVNCVNPDGSDGFAAASKYIGKYMSKGEFECPSVTCGYAVKGRLASSRGLGDVLPQSLVEYYRCYDVVGYYDINKPLPNDTIKKLVELLRQRSSIVIGNTVFRIPGKYLRQIWYIQGSDKTFHASIVRKQICFALQRDAFNDLLGEFRERFPDITPERLLELVRSELDRRRVAACLKDKAGKQRYQKFILTSYF